MSPFVTSVAVILFPSLSLDFLYTIYSSRIFYFYIGKSVYPLLYGSKLYIMLKRAIPIPRSFLKFIKVLV